MAVILGALGRGLWSAALRPVRVLRPSVVPRCVCSLGAQVAGSVLCGIDSLSSEENTALCFSFGGSRATEPCPLLLLFGNIQFKGKPYPSPDAAPLVSQVWVPPPGVGRSVNGCRVTWVVERVTQGPAALGAPAPISRPTCWGHGRPWEAACLAAGAP